MHAKLGTSEAEAMELANVSKRVRHGQGSHVDVVAAMRAQRRRRLLEVARSIVRAEISHVVGHPLVII